MLRSNGPQQVYLTPSEVADFLHVSVDTVYRHVPCLRVGGSVRISSASLDSWIASNSFPSARPKAQAPFARPRSAPRSGPKENTRRKESNE
jgi:excisionase family DNA binding protein